jgi:hypothetical protein
MSQQRSENQLRHDVTLPDSSRVTDTCDQPTDPRATARTLLHEEEQSSL